MYVITCKFKKNQMNSKQETGFNACSYNLSKKDWMQNNQEKVETPFSASYEYWCIFRHSSANYSIFCGTI